MVVVSGDFIYPSVKSHPTEFIYTVQSRYCIRVFLYIFFPHHLQSVHYKCTSSLHEGSLYIKKNLDTDFLPFSFSVTVC